MTRTNERGRISMRETLRQMPVGGSISVSLGTIGYASIRNACSLLSFELERSYSVHLNRVERTYEVTRNN